MIKRLTSLILAVFFICSISRANEEYDISFDRGQNQPQRIDLPYGIMTFTLTDYGNTFKILVSLENTTTSQAILLFKNSHDEKTLKKNKPKVELKKTYPGDKGKRHVYGCNHLIQPFISIIPEDKIDLFSLNIPSSVPTKLEIPIYLAEYNGKQLLKKGTYNTNYKILSEDILKFNIEIKGWSENDPEYLATKATVAKYIRSVSSAAFCKNKAHRPSLAEQIKPYQETKDSLLNSIQNIIKSHLDWMSDMPPHIAYTALISELNNIDLKEHTYDCGEHKTAGKKHSCNYCSLSAQQIYHQLDDLYQQLRAGKTTKDAAVKKAKGLYTCYQNSSKRKKDASYNDKISKFYNRIIN